MAGPTNNQGYPFPGSPLVDPKSGLVTQVWARFFLSLWNYAFGNGLVFTFADLPSNVAVGTRGLCTTSSVNTFGATLVGGGTYTMPVTYIGSGTWIVG